MESAEAVRVHARELADVISAVKIADDEATREAIFRFRYSIYVDELRRGVGAVDVGDRSQRDPEDDEPNAVLIYTTAEDGFPGLAEIGSAELGRVMLRRDRRVDPGSCRWSARPTWWQRRSFGQTSSS